MSRNPAITPRVPPREEWSSRWAPGISSSTTTYSMAPAAKESSQGISGWRLPTIRTVSRAKMGSTTPDRAPIQKDLARLSQGDGSPLGEVLDADTQGQSDGGGELGGGVPLGGQRKGDAHRHPLRDVVESDGQDQKGGPAAQMAEGFRGELGEQGVHGQQEGDAQDGPPSGRDPSHHAHGLRLLDGGDQEAPHAGGDHHAGGEPQEDPVDRGVRAAPEEKYGGRPQGGEQSGEPCSAGGP